MFSGKKVKCACAYVRIYVAERATPPPVIDGNAAVVPAGVRPGTRRSSLPGATAGKRRSSALRGAAAIQSRAGDSNFIFNHLVEI